MGRLCSGEPRASSKFPLSKELLKVSQSVRERLLASCFSCANRSKAGVSLQVIFYLRQSTNTLHITRSLPKTFSLLLFNLR